MSSLFTRSPSIASKLALAERNLLSLLPAAHDVRQLAVAIPPNSLWGASQTINALQISGSSRSQAAPLVFLHGYASGLALFFKNLVELRDLTGRSVIAVDLLGFGRSSRPQFPSTRGTSDLRATRAESFFVESIREMLRALRLDRVVLVGHSLGGLIAAAFSTRYNELLERLVLVSPVGVPSAPAPSPSTSSYSWQHRMFVSLWELGVTPQAVLRALPRSQSERLAHRFGQSRFRGSLSAAEVKAVVDYLYLASLMKRSGESALNTILMPGAYARLPLLNRVAALPRSVPTLMLYGSYDWMDVDAGVALARAMGPQWQAAVIDNAGHHLYLDNAPEFNAMVASFVGSE